MLKVIFSGAFRPLFLLVGASAPIAVAMWVVYYFGYLPGWQPFSAGENPLNWHMHEMLFGVLGAAVGGFLFTAVANWTGRTPLQGGMLMLLVTTWIAGRVVMWPGMGLDPRLVAGIDLSYLLLVVLLLWRELYLGGNRRNYVLLLVIALLLVSNVTYHLPDPFGALPGIRGGTLAIAILISVIGGRIIPAFTRNWMMQQQVKVAPPAEFNRLDGAAIAATLAVLPCWILIPTQPLTGWLMTLCAIAHAIRLSRWRGVHTWRDPLVLVLHVAYSWIPIGFLVLGGSILLGHPTSAGVHALTVGAMTTMVMAVSSRAAMGHTGHPLRATRMLTGSYVLITVAAALRVTAGFVPSIDLISLAGVVWVAAFAAFVIALGPILVRPRIDPV